MKLLKKIPLKIWTVIIISYIIPIFCESTFLDSSLFEMQWFLYLIPVFFFAYFYGLRAGIVSSILSNLFFLLYELIKAFNGESAPIWKVYFLLTISLISLIIAIGIGILTNQLNKLTITDPLTNLYNRRYINQYEIGQKSRSIFFIDLDRFKFINDSLGHKIGDQILQMVSKRLQETAGKHDIIARLGGDEFVFITDENNTNKIKKKAKKILQKMAIPYNIGGNELFLTASIGISKSPEHGKALDDLIAKADMAMYKAKQQGKNQYQFYLEKMNEEILELTEMEKGLHKALKQNEFILYYQPKVDLQTNKVIGMEALVRWEHPQNGLIPPAKFIPLAEETGLIVPLGAWVMYTACWQNKKWQDAGFPPLRVSVNISARQFQEEYLISTVKSILKQTGLAPEWLELEITESMLMANIGRAVKTLQQLKEIGVYLSIDDFGTGYSSLNYLKRMPIDCLKIDQSFVRDILSDASIANAIITLGHNLHMDVIAEGIEAQPQAYTLQKQNCDFGQGYLYSPPLPDYQFEEKFLSPVLVR